MIKTFNKFILAPLLINLFINMFINTGSYITAKAFGLPSYMQIVAGEAKADSYYLVPYQCVPSNPTFAGSTHHRTQTFNNKLSCNTDNLSLEPQITTTSGTTQYSTSCTTGNRVLGTGLYYEYEADFEQFGDTNEHRAMYACGVGEDWNAHDTDQDGVINSLDYKWWDASVSDPPADFCSSQSDQIIIEQGKEWNLQPAGLPDKYTTDIGGTLCVFDRTATVVDGTNVTATYHPAAGVGSVADKPTDFSQFVLRRCEGEVLTGTSTAIAFDALPNQICATTNYGVCVFENPQTSGSEGNLSVTYTGIDTVSCDASSVITLDWDSYTEHCNERQNLEFIHTGDEFTSDVPLTIGDGQCEYNGINFVCSDGFCVATYQPNGNTSTNNTESLSEYVTEDIVPDVPSQSGSFNPAEGAALDIDIAYIDTTGRNDICIEVTNCTEQYGGGICRPSIINNQIDLLDNHINRIEDIHDAADDNLVFHYNGYLRYDNNPQLGQTQYISYDPQVNCSAYAIPEESRIVGSGGGYGDGTGNYTINHALVRGNNPYVYDIEGEQGDNSHSCLLDQRIVGTTTGNSLQFRERRATYHITSHGFSNNGSCAAYTSDGNNNNNEETPTEEESSIIEKLDELIEKFNPASEEELTAFEQATQAPDDSEVFQELDISQGWQPYDVFGIGVPTQCTPLELSSPEIPLNLGIATVTIPATDYSLDMTSFCEMADVIRPILITMALLSGLFIIRSNV